MQNCRLFIYCERFNSEQAMGTCNFSSLSFLTLHTLISLITIIHSSHWVVLMVVTIDYLVQMGPIVKSTVNSFRLLPATENYVSPSKDPWRFWWLCFLISHLVLVASCSILYVGENVESNAYWWYFLCLIEFWHISIMFLIWAMQKFSDTRHWKRVECICSGFYVSLRRLGRTYSCWFMDEMLSKHIHVHLHYFNST